MPPPPRSRARRESRATGWRRRPPRTTGSAAPPPRRGAAADRGGRPRPPRSARSVPGLGPLVPRGEVLRLLLGQPVDVDAHGLELEAGDLVVDLARDVVDAPLQR